MGNLRLQSGQAIRAKAGRTPCYHTRLLRSARRTRSKQTVERIPKGWRRSQPRYPPIPDKQRQMRAFENPHFYLYHLLRSKSRRHGQKSCSGRERKRVRLDIDEGPSKRTDRSIETSEFGRFKISEKASEP